MRKLRALYELLYIVFQIIYALCVNIRVTIILFLITLKFDKLKKTVKKLSFLYSFLIFETKSRFDLYNRRKVDKRVKNSFTISK